MGFRKKTDEARAMNDVTMGNSASEENMTSIRRKPKMGRFPVGLKSLHMRDFDLSETIYVKF